MPTEPAYPQTYRIAKLSELTEHPDNPRQGDVGAIITSVEANGFYGALVVQKDSGRVLAGNHRMKALKAKGVTSAPIIELDVDDRTALRILLGDNRTGDLASYDEGKLLDLLMQAAAEDNLLGTGYDGDDIDTMLSDLAGPDAKQTIHHGALSARFLVPPFTVLDARQGYWQDRKKEWIGLGIHSELGRGKDLTFKIDALKAKLSGLGSLTGTSIFDPVLCEVAYRWFAPPEAKVLDPFAGGSVRGVVAAALGHRYTGIDLAGLQLRANAEQWRRIEPKLAITLTGTEGDHVERDDDAATVGPGDLTPVQRFGEQWVKRDDLVEVGGVRGGKVRTCWALAQDADAGKASGLVTAGSRSSPQVNIVAHIAKELGIPCRVHTPEGQASDEVRAAISAGAERVSHKAGYNNVIVKRARDDAAERGWVEIPFGMEHPEAIMQTRRQAQNLPLEPPEVQRIVVPVGSGMSLAGILHGLLDTEREVPPVLGVVVGADPTERLDEYAPAGWRDMVTLVPSGSKYDTPAKTTVWNGIVLDAHYEAKCLPFLAEGDLLWIVGVRQTQLAAGPPPATDRLAPTWIEGDSLEVLDTLPDESYDLIFTCPPYAGLERYSDDPRDISTMPYGEFDATLSTIFGKALAKLKPDRYAVVVIGEVRDPEDPTGSYHGIVPDVIRAFTAAGAHFYNEAILVTAIGSLAARAGRHFESGRKLGRAHQNVLIFVKGDPQRAHEALGQVLIPAESLENLPTDVTDDD